MQVTGNTILVTGGGSGIGAGLAEAFAVAGNRVIVAGRRQASVDAVAARHPGITAMTLDITDAAAIARFAERVVAEFPALNVVVHSAGIMVAEDLVDLDTAEATIATNLLGPIRLTHALLPQLLKHDHATLITVSSGLAFVPMAATPTYSATKAAIHSWSQSMREQLKDTGVEVIEIAPPGVRTELMPGLTEAEYAMSLDEFIADIMLQLRQEPTPNEMLVDQVKFLWNASHSESYDAVFGMVNQSG